MTLLLVLMWLMSAATPDVALAVCVCIIEGQLMLAWAPFDIVDGELGDPGVELH